MATLQELETFTAQYAEARRALTDDVRHLQSDIDKVKAERLPTIRVRAAVLAALHDELLAQIRESAALFEKPRTRIVHGIKIGMAKNKGAVEIDNEAAVIKRIRAQLPAEQAELLIRVRESVHKPAVYDLTASDLKRLGIRVTDDGDEPVIRSTDSEIDKLVSALLADGEAAAEAP